MRISTTRLSLLFVSVLLGCGGGGGNTPVDSGVVPPRDGETPRPDADLPSPCAARVCGDNGRCVESSPTEARCDCDAGYFDDGVSCARQIAPGETLTTLEIREGASVSRQADVVRTGVPLPRGLVSDERLLGLFAADDTPLPIQTRVTSRWPDGSVRWLLVDTQSDIAADGTASVSLRRLDSARVDTAGVTVDERADRVVVDTGPLQVEIPTGYGGVIDRMVVDGSELIASPTMAERDARGPYIEAGGSSYTGSRLLSTSEPNAGDSILGYWDYSSSSGMSARDFNRYDPWHLGVVVEEQGPLHTVVRVSGALLDASGASFGRFVTRLHFFRGRRDFRVDHTLVYTGRGNREPVEAYGLRLPLTGGTGMVEGEAGDGQVLHTAYAGFTTPAGSQSGQALGYAARSGAGGSLAVVLRDMAEYFPKAIRTDAAGLDVQLHPADAGPWDLSRYSSSIDTDCYETGSISTNRGAQGLSRTDQIWIEAASTPVDASRVQALARAVDGGPLMMLAPPIWYSDARVMGLGSFVFDTSLNANEVHFRIDRQLRIAEDFMRLAQRREFSWFGAEDYGDIRGLFSSGNSGTQAFVVCGRYGWSGNSGEPSNQLWTQYLRRPHQQLLRDAEALARHTLDQQMVHYGTAQDEVGGDGRNAPFSVGSLHRHGMQPFSGYAKQPEYSHVAGVETYYYLTGDERARDALFEAAQFIARYQTNTSMVNGIGVLSRALAAFESDPAAKAEVVAGWRVRLGELVGMLPGHISDELSGGSTPFNGFIRGMTGLAYYHEWSHDSAAASAFFEGVDQALSQADAWELRTVGGNSELYHMQSFAYAADIASSNGRDPAPYFELTQRMLELNTHTQEVGGTTSAIPLAALEAIPASWRDWTWTYTRSYDASSSGILWLHRQIFFRDDNMQAYHSYRAFTHLAAAAATVPPDQPGLQTR
ncbi:MAG: hypothetical protein GXP55_24455 [Deltaproteobacteria bacterium]|nr:hypothetical protein [Deltaproteobacteria bacterium]